MFNALLAKRLNGIFLLRIEDTDVSRSEAAYRTAIEEDLHWLDLEWQEGPYLQSQRGETYRRYYDKLIANDRVYPCFCSEQALKLARKSQIAAGQPPRYPGACAQLSADEIRSKQEQGLKPVLRFRVPKGEMIEFDDQVHGPQRFDSDAIGDFIIRRSDGTPAFFFTNALDDALMGVTHVLRGQDHLTNTPRQLMLLKALGLTAPLYGHISLITDRDGSPLSKRRGAQSIKDLRAAGYLPGAVNNYLARLGHVYARDDGLSLAQLAGDFDPSHLGRAPARYDPAQLLHWQKETVLRADDDTLSSWLEERRVDLPLALSAEQRQAYIGLVRENAVLPTDAAWLAAMIFADTIDYADDARAAIHEAGADYYQAALEALTESHGEYEPLIEGIKSETRQGKALFMPLRAALTGRLHGPELARMLELISIERARRRLRSALEMADR